MSTLKLWITPRGQSHEPYTIGWWFHRLTCIPFLGYMIFDLWTIFNCIWPRWMYGQYGISKPVYEWLVSRRPIGAAVEAIK